MEDGTDVTVLEIAITSCAEREKRKSPGRRGRGADCMGLSKNCKKGGNGILNIAI